MPRDLKGGGGGGGGRLNFCFIGQGSFDQFVRGKILRQRHQHGGGGGGGGEELLGIVHSPSRI